MNWIILLLLFGCCGNNCGCRSDRSGGDCECGRRNCCREERRNNCRCDASCNNCCEASRDNCGCARENAREARENAREAVREAREAVRDAREAVREAREQGCDSPGMVPPPWQDYPPMPRRDSDCGCEG